VPQCRIIPKLLKISGSCCYPHGGRTLWGKNAFAQGANIILRKLRGATLAADG
jgi:hypothetical protein